MDPQTAWEELLAAFAAAEWDRVQDVAEGLLHWLSRGGFPPRQVTGVDLGQEWDRAIATAGCEFALSKVEEYLSHDAP